MVVTGAVVLLKNTVSTVVANVVEEPLKVKLSVPDFTTEVVDMT